MIATLQLGRQLQDKFSPSDVVQATFLQAQKGIREFDGVTERELAAWLRKILVTQLVSEIRRYSTKARDVKLERNVHRKIDQSSVLLARLCAANLETPSQLAMKHERGVVLAGALDQLPDHYRQVIVLRHLKSYRFEEVAQEMKQSVDSVKSIWRRAIGRLRDLIGDEPV